MPPVEWAVGCITSVTQTQEDNTKGKICKIPRTLCDKTLTIYFCESISALVTISTANPQVYVLVLLFLKHIVYKYM
jgi:hypothetical protein